MPNGQPRRCLDALESRGRSSASGPQCPARGARAHGRLVSRRARRGGTPDSGAPCAAAARATRQGGSRPSRRARPLSGEAASSSERRRAVDRGRAPRRRAAQRLALLPGRRPDLLLHDRLGRRPRSPAGDRDRVRLVAARGARRGGRRAELPRALPRHRRDPGAAAAPARARRVLRDRPSGCSAAGLARLGAVAWIVAPYAVDPALRRPLPRPLGRSDPPPAPRPLRRWATSPRWSARAVPRTCCSATSTRPAGRRLPSPASSRASRSGLKPSTGLFLAGARGRRRLRAPAAWAAAFVLGARARRSDTRVWKYRGLGNLPCSQLVRDERARAGRSAGPRRRERYPQVRQPRLEHLEQKSRRDPRVLLEQPARRVDPDRRRDSARCGGPRPKRRLARRLARRLRHRQGHTRRGLGRHGVVLAAAQPRLAGLPVARRLDPRARADPRPARLDRHAAAPRPRRLSAHVLGRGRRARLLPLVVRRVRSRATSVQPRPDATTGANLYLPVDPSFHVDATAAGGAVTLSWRGPRPAACGRRTSSCARRRPAAPDDALGCDRRTGASAARSHDGVSATAAAPFVDRPGPGRWVYRVAQAASYTGRPSEGDPLVYSEPVTVRVATADRPPSAARARRGARAAAPAGRSRRSAGRARSSSGATRG